jgi:D-glycerate 3-kinase
MKYELFRPPVDAVTVEEKLYSPLTRWVILNKPRGPKSVVVGVNGPQGAGKSTLCRELVSRLSHAGAIAVSLSLDDFYLTRKQQVQLAKQNASNPYLQNRGYPGTHDVNLANAVLNRLVSRETGLSVPTYDKSAFGGKGDRASEASWLKVSKAPDFIFFEGWMVGFKPAVLNVTSELAEINKRLEAYLPLWQKFDEFIFLDPVEENFVVNWRIEAEEKMRASGKAGMSREETEIYVRTFLPAYQMYLPELRESAPASRSALRVRVAQDRSPL